MSTKKASPQKKHTIEQDHHEGVTKKAKVDSGADSSSYVPYIANGYHSLQTYLSMPMYETAKAIAWYEKAFGAKEIYRLKGRDEKQIVHAEIQFGTCRFMLSDRDPRWAQGPLVTGNNLTMCFYTPCVDSLYERAVNAGAKGLNPPTTHFYGDRSAQVEDIFGVKWSLMTHVKDVSPEEMQRLSYEMEDSMCTGGQDNGKKE